MGTISAEAMHITSDEPIRPMHQLIVIKVAMSVKDQNQDD